MDLASGHFALIWAVGIGIAYAAVLSLIPSRWHHHPATVFLRRAFPLLFLLGLYPAARKLLVSWLP